jgi:DNA-binding IclR family transcriptional regulator
MKNTKENILNVLKVHPEGLTTVDIAKILKISRNTASKYVYQLLAEGKIRQREIGTAKLCLLNGEEHERE